MKDPITQPVSLRQPDRTIALYVQGDHGYAMYPPHGKTLDREIVLSSYESGVWYSVHTATGGVHSGGVRLW